MERELKKEYESKIENITGDGMYKESFKHVVTFEDGVVMSFTSQNEDSGFKKGDEVVYIVNWKGDRGMLGSVKKKGEQKSYGNRKGGGYQKIDSKDRFQEQMIKNPGFALSYANQFYYSQGADDSLTGPSEQVLALSESYLEWLNNKTFEAYNKVKEVK